MRTKAKDCFCHYFMQCSLREKPTCLLCLITLLARASQPTWSSSLMQRLFLLSFPRLLSSSSQCKYTARFFQLRSQTYHNCIWHYATEKKEMSADSPPNLRTGRGRKHPGRSHLGGIVQGTVGSW